MSRIILHTYYCDLDAYRNDEFELSIDLPCDANIAIVKKVEELANLDQIKSDFSVSFELPLSSRELYIFNRLEYSLSNNGRMVYNATLEVDGLQAIDGQLYIDSSSERIYDGYVTYNVQLIGTHQRWKEMFKSWTLKDLELGEFEWLSADIVDLWQNNDVYSDGSDTIYPLLANFGKWYGQITEFINNGVDDVTLYDVRYLVYKLPILTQMFCKAGYKIKSSFLNSDAFRNQADYLLEQDFGINENIDQGIEAIVETGVALTNNTGLNLPIDFTVTIKDRLTLFNGVTDAYNNSTSRPLTDIFLDIDFEFCNLTGASPAYFGVDLFVSDAGFLPVLGPYAIPEFDYKTSSSLNNGQCVTISVTINLSQLLRDNLINSGYVENNWNIQLLLSGNGVSSPRATLSSGARWRIYSQSANHFNVSDIFDISKLLDSTFTLYDYLLDNKLLYNLRFKTDEANKIVYIEPYPATYETYQTLRVDSFLAEGFVGNPNKPSEVIDITEKIDICQLVEKQFPDTKQNIYYFFKFKDSNDKYDRYENFPNATNPLFANDTSEGQMNIEKREIKLALYEPALNDYDLFPSSANSYRVYLPFMWENEKADGITENPTPGTNLGIRTFNVYGWQTQVSEIGDSLNAIGIIFEGVTYQFVPNVGQVFEAKITLSLSTYGIPTQNNVFKDNLSALELVKNIVNTFYGFEVSQQREAVEFPLTLYFDNLDFYQMDIRKIVRIFSENSSLIRYNGNYLWLQVTKQLGENKAMIILKPILPCNNG